MVRRRNHTAPPSQAPKPPLKKAGKAAEVPSTPANDALPVAVSNTSSNLLGLQHTPSNVDQWVQDPPEMSLQDMTEMAALIEQQLLMTQISYTAWPQLLQAHQQIPQQVQVQYDMSRKTPWFPQGKPVPSTFAEEVVNFVQLVSLSQQEVDQRKAVYQLVAYTHQQTWPRTRSCKSEIAVEGCFPLGISEPSAPLQILISKVKNLRLEQIKSLGIQGNAAQTAFDAATRTGRYECVTANGIALKIRITEERDKGESRRNAMRNALNDVPYAKLLCILLRHVLYHACASLIGDAEGALPIEALLALCVYVCRKSRGADPGVCLTNFLQEIGSGVDFAEYAVNPKGQLQPRQDRTAQIEVCAFENPSVNLAAGCTCFRMLRAHLQSFDAALRSFNPGTALTMLSTMVAHRPLWRRVNGLQKPETPSMTTPESVPANVLNQLSPNSQVNLSHSTQGLTPDSPFMMPLANDGLDIGRTRSLTIGKHASFGGESPAVQDLMFNRVKTGLPNIKLPDEGQEQQLTYARAQTTLEQLARDFPEAVNSQQLPPTAAHTRFKMQMDQRLSSGSLTREVRALKGMHGTVETSPPTSTSACSEYEYSASADGFASEHESTQSWGGGSGWGVEQYQPADNMMGGRHAPQQTMSHDQPWDVTVQLPGGEIDHVTFPMFLSPGSNIILEKSYGNVMGMIISCAPQQHRPHAYEHPVPVPMLHQQPKQPVEPEYAPQPPRRVHQHCPYAL